MRADRMTWAVFGASSPEVLLASPVWLPCSPSRSCIWALPPPPPDWRVEEDCPAEPLAVYETAAELAKGRYSVARPAIEPAADPVAHVHVNRADAEAARRCSDIPVLKTDTGLSGLTG